jgi:hypothetical protein
MASESVARNGEACVERQRDHGVQLRTFNDDIVERLGAASAVVVT